MKVSYSLISLINTKFSNGNHYSKQILPKRFRKTASRKWEETHVSKEALLTFFSHTKIIKAIGKKKKKARISSFLLGLQDQEFLALCQFLPGSWHLYYSAKCAADPKALFPHSVLPHLVLHIRGHPKSFSLIVYKYIYKKNATIMDYRDMYLVFILYIDLVMMKYYNHPEDWSKT